MHELGIVYEVIKIVDGFVEDQDITKVEKIVLEIGQPSQAIPRFIESCYPAAVSETPYENTQLEIITVPALGKCQACDNIYNIIEERKVCPKCDQDKFNLISGEDFNIKEILAY